MSLFLGILAAAALGGGFTIYPASGDSRDRIAIAIVLWVVGAALAFGAGYLDHKGRKKSEGNGHESPVDPRDSLKQMLIDERAEGMKINGQKFVAVTERDAPLWQARVAALLRDSLVNQDCWLRFKQMSQEPGSKLPNQLWDQIRFLEEIVQNFSAYELRATWRPPTPGDH